MGAFHINNEMPTTPALQALTTTSKTLINLAAQTTPARRGKVTHFEMSINAATPQDLQFGFDMVRTTAAPTGTAATPKPTDDADGTAPAASVTIVNATAEGTVVANSQIYGPKYCNVRGGLSWYANDDDEALKYGPTNLAGLSMRCRAQAAPSSSHFGSCSIWFKD